MPNSPHPFLEVRVSQPILLITGSLALFYFFAIAFLFPVGNRWLFGIFIAGEVFRLWQLMTYLYTVWDTSYKPFFKGFFHPPVDVFITVAGEPVEIVEKTVRAAKAMRYPYGRHQVSILNDGLVAKKKNWKEIIALAQRLGVHCITRRIPGGAKAGNINHALRETGRPYVAIFDADHVPHPDFLEKTIGYFADPMMGFIQTPQYYKNHNQNKVTQGAWEQQEIFFGTIKQGKNRMNATFMCGTNMVVRRRALEEAGGMCETNIAEDFLTSLFIHERGWHSYYHPEVLAEGLAPEDLLSYFKQQFRWARGSLEIIFRYNPFLRSGLTFSQRLQYLSSSSFYLTGLVSFINMLFPLIFLYSGLMVFNMSTMTLAVIFFPYMLLTLYTLALSTNFNFTFQALAFTFASFSIHLRALMAVLFNEKNGFSVTSKKKVEGNFLHLVIPHLLYIGVGIVGVGVAVFREGFSNAVLTNIAWLSLSSTLFLPFITAAFSVTLILESLTRIFQAFRFRRERIQTIIFLKE